MKRFSKTKICLAIMLSFWATGHVVFGQTNTFPDTGKAGIGTTSPFLSLHIQGTQSGALLPLLLLRNFSSTASSAVSLDFTNFSGTQTSTQIGARIQALRTNPDARHTLVFSTANGSWVLSEKMRLTDTGSLGIGTSTPQGKLDVSGQFYTSIGNSIVLRAQNSTNEGGQLRFDGADTNRYFYFDNFAGNLRFFTQNASGESEKVRILNNGAVGIGTTAPGAYKLNVNGSMFVGNAITSPSSGTLLGNTDTGSGIILDHTGFGFISSSNWKYGILLDPDGGQGGEYFAVYDHLSKSQITDANAFVKFNPAGNSWINTGNLGIGTSNPPSGFKLAVNGKIKAKEIVVDTTGWADFVLAEDYPLKSLEEVEQYIKTNQHLPGIPSEKEVAENGVSLGEMQAKLLQKIEELTLYMIELKKENDLLQKRVSSLEKQQQ